MKTLNDAVESDTLSGRVKRAVTSVRLSFLVNWSRGCRRWRSGRPLPEPAPSRPTGGARRRWKARVTLLLEFRS